MAHLSDVIRSGIRAEDLTQLPDDLRSALEPLLRYVNQGVQGLASAVGDLSISGNLANEVQTVPLTHGVAQLVSLKKLSQAKGVRALSVGSPDGKTQNMLAQPLHLIGTTVPNQVKVIANFADTTATRVPVTMELTPEGSYTSLTPSTGTWTAVGAAGAPAFQNSWANFGAPWEVAGYMKDSMGFVHLRGLIKSGTIAALAFTLPSGFRPANGQIFASIDGLNTGQRLDVDSAGGVKPATGNNGIFTLSGVTFDTR